MRAKQKSTESGKLYYDDIDFFNDEVVQSTILEIVESSIYKEIINQQK